MDTAGLVFVLVGIYLLTAAVKNRRPVETAKSIIANPNAVRSTLDSETGYEMASPNTGAVAAPADGSDSAASPDVKTNSIKASGNAQTAIAYARKQIGKPYIWGGVGPRGYDCSGLVSKAWKAAGYGTPRTTAGMLASSKLKPVKKSDLIPGDLVFPYPGHVMLYIGGGKVIEAPGRGKKIRQRKLTSFWKGRRVPINKGASL